MLYAVGLYPLLLAAGGVALEGWLAVRGRRLALAAAVVIAALVSAVVALPLVPERSLADTPIPAMNEDAVETIAWPEFAGAVAWRSLPARERNTAVIFTANYGEAGALRRYGPALGLPPAYSGHNSFRSFGRPPGSAGPVMAVGFREQGNLDRFFRGCRLVARFDNGLGIDNEEQGAPLSVCGSPRRPWRELWPRLHHLDA